METHDQIPSCLSVDPHDDNITDPVLHCFGYLKAWQRESFFDLASPHWKSEVERYVRSGTRRSTAEAAVAKKRDACRKDCSDETRRVSLILGALSIDNNQFNLLKSLACSRMLWRSTGEFASGLERVRAWRLDRGMQNGVMIVPPPVATNEVYNPDNLAASIMTFEDGAPYNIDSRRVTGTFPNQTTTVADLLRRESFGLLNLIKDRKNGRSATTVTWLHIPSNNMLWVEHVTMERADQAEIKCVMAMKLHELQGSYENISGGDSSMEIQVNRALASCVPSASSLHLAPFLHWETSRQLTLMTRKIEQQLASNTSSQRLKAHFEREKRKKERGVQTSRWPLSNRVAVEERQRRFNLVEPEGKRFRSKHPLGQYLLNASRLYEEVRNYQDTSLIQKYLFADPPLHPRRTLDQGYYTSLQTTRTRDRSQVVYRATTPVKSPHHQFDHLTGLWTCHKLFEGCEECCANIRKVSRVVMVDQLWMWILDQKTIISYFPKRYGVHGSDPSGVFEAIQRRLIRERPIHSVLAVAHTILDECSNTFFDRMKDFSGQPQVLDIFSEAIRDVSRKQTLESQRLWNWIDRARRINRQQGPHRDLDIPGWTMSAEGDLEREIQDIVEELEIMISVNKTQLDVYKKFIQHTARIANAGDKGSAWSNDGEAQLGAAKLIAKVEDRIDYLESLLKTGYNAANLSPLSFLSSIFGMNNAEFGENQWKVSDQVKLILSISVGVTALALVFASRRISIRPYWKSNALTFDYD
ncbi:hypothetical protein E0Z10_g4112 [Xylaria hypoxylon]|uniref:Uncharacterized protein n=1 Tax=Xylaria hypoxylon TaxID=37992 RepID=A0A4Z0Z827_9PEZI|nr:hypothetical protein E0Z10_g4112 [Xylaria hypoxylon]